MRSLTDDEREKESDRVRRQINDKQRVLAQI
jgi:hypothetical protein